MSYTLFYKKLKIASISNISEDFPNLSGNYILAEDIESKNNFLLQYINYSITASKLMEENIEEWEEYILQEEAKYIDIIESNEWLLVGQNTEKHQVLVPVFCYDNSLVWRFKITKRIRNYCRV